MGAFLALAKPSPRVARRSFPSRRSTWAVIGLCLRYGRAEIGTCRHLVPKLRLGNPKSRSSASQDGKWSFQEVRSQAGAWERVMRPEHRSARVSRPRRNGRPKVSEYGASPKGRPAVELGAESGDRAQPNNPETQHPNSETYEQSAGEVSTTKHHSPGASLKPATHDPRATEGRLFYCSLRTSGSGRKVIGRWQSVLPSGVGYNR